MDRRPTREGCWRKGVSKPIYPRCRNPWCWPCREADAREIIEAARLFAGTAGRLIAEDERDDRLTKEQGE